MQKKGNKTYKVLAFVCLMIPCFMLGLPNSSRADDHVGFKKVFLRAHCKADPSYVCRLSDPPDISLGKLIPLLF